MAQGGASLQLSEEREKMQTQEMTGEERPDRRNGVSSSEGNE